MMMMKSGGKKYSLIDRFEYDFTMLSLTSRQWLCGMGHRIATFR